jgi:predicted nucleic acid-binding protein
MPYLVDTDVLIDISRNNEDAIDFLDQLDDSWSMSIITALELIVGARNKKEVTQLRQRDQRTFEFTILQRVSPDMDATDVIELEGSWKRRLHTYAPYGLNDN